jgi:hypothetical protein
MNQNARYFNTGKVLIGCAYQRPLPRIEGDAHRLQTSLIQPGRRVPEPLRLVAALVWRML